MTELKENVYTAVYNEKRCLGNTPALRCPMVLLNSVVHVFSTSTFINIIDEDTNEDRVFWAQTALIRLASAIA
jgi:hypothetical protein